MRTALLLLTLLLTAAPRGGVAAQILRQPPRDSAARPVGVPRVGADAGRIAQREFERFRREHLPRSGSGRPGRCDEIVGRFCYWYDDKGPAMPEEPAAIGTARAALIATLDSLVQADRSDRWLSGQLVRYLVEADRLEAAELVAARCEVRGWWCDALRGFVAHAAQEYGSADKAFATALGRMAPRDRCQWRDMTPLLDDEARQRYRQLACGTAKEGFEDRVWFFAQTRLGQVGNDARTEWYARQLYAQFLTDGASVHQFGFDDDERELLLRFGWPRAWSRGPSGDPRIPMSITGHEPIPAYRYIPAGYVLNDPSVSDSADWRPQQPPVMGRYGPSYATALLPLEHQKALFRRGDTTLVALTYDVGAVPVFSGTRLDAALTVTPGDVPAPRTERRADTRTRGQFLLRAPAGSLLMSAEVSAPARTALARARYGVTLPYAVGTRVTLSDLLFYTPYGSFPQTLEEVLPHMMATERVRADRKLGVYWEAYNTDPAGERIKFSLTVVREVEEDGSFLRRRAKALRLTREATPVSVSVEDVSARGARTSPRALELDISTLKKGAYIVQLEIEAAGQYVLRADHRIEIIGP